MTTLPEEAVKAAMDAFHEAWNNNQGLDNELPAYAHRAALTAALPFLPVQGAVKKLEWIEIPACNGLNTARTEFGTYTIGSSLVVRYGLKSISKPLATLEDAKAAAQADYEARILSALEPSAAQPDPWVDTRLVRFDDTIVFGRGGFDFDRWESLRWEMHTRHGSFAVWKSESKTWSMYGGKYSFLMLDRFSSEEEAKAEAEQIVISLDAEPSAARAQALEEIIALCRDYGEDSQPDSEYRLACNDIIEAIQERRSLSSPDHADAGKVEGDVEKWSIREIVAKAIAYHSVGDPHAKTIRGDQRWEWFVEEADKFISVFGYYLPAIPSAPASEGAE